MTDDNSHAEKFIEIPLEIVTVGSQSAILSPTNDQVHDLLTTIQPIVEEITGLASRWSGRTRIAEAVDQEGFPKFSGRKEWNCDITIHRSQLATLGWYGTALHEMLHSISRGLIVDDYLRFKGYEEGVVEALTRLLFAEVYTKADIGAIFSERSHYQRYVQDLENLRGRISFNKTDFYFGLISASLNQREELVVQWIISMNPSLSHERILSQMDTILGRLKL